MNFNQLYNFYLTKFFIPQYQIEGAILGCLGQNADKVQYNVTEYLEEDDPWIAIIQSKNLLTKIEVQMWHQYHNVDVDKKGIPYYFIVTKNSTNQKFIWFSDQQNMTPIQQARELGLKKGLNPQYLDF